MVFIFLEVDKYLVQKVVTFKGDPQGTHTREKEEEGGRTISLFGEKWCRHNASFPPKKRGGGRWVKKMVKEEERRKGGGGELDEVL